MISKNLIEGYFQSANAHNIDNMLEYFSENAVVYDEGREHHGLEAIGEWIKNTNAKYSTQYELIDLHEDGSNVKVRASVSGTFPGSPIELSSLFTIDSDKISVLKCAV